MQCASDNGVGPTAAVAGGILRFLEGPNGESVEESPNKDTGVQGCGHSLLLQLRQTNRQNLHSPRSRCRRITLLHFSQRLAPPYQNHQPGPVTSFDSPGRPGPALRVPVRRRTGVQPSGFPNQRRRKATSFHLQVQLQGQEPCSLPFAQR